MIRTYSELIQLPTFEERFQYLQLNGAVAKETFGYDRWINQQFYQKDIRWKKIRDKVIIRDCGCDLACKGFEIYGRIYIHHMNPIMLQDLLDQTEFLLEPEYLICTSFNTHQAIHYGDERLVIANPVQRMPNDTCPWKR